MNSITIVWGRVVDHWFAWMTVISWQVAVVAAAVALISFLLRRRSARFRYALWTLVPIRLAIPPTLALATGWAWWVMPAAEPSQPGSRQQAARSISEEPTTPGKSTQQESFGRDSVVSSALRQPAAANSAVSSGSALAVAATDTPLTGYSFRWVDLLFGGWLAGCIVSAIYFSLGYRKVRQLVENAKPADAATAALIDSCVKAIGLRQQVRVALSLYIQTPLVTGLLRPVILLSPTLMSQLTPQQLRAVIMHELQHVARGDLWHQRVVMLIQGVYFFHPCVWWAAKQLCRLREQACDEATVAALGGCREDYGAGIVRVAEMTSRQATHFALGVADSGEGTALRLRRIFDPRLPVGCRLGWTSRLAVTIIALFLIPCAAAPGVAQPPAITDETAAAAPLELIEISGTVVDADGEAVGDADVTMHAETMHGEMSPEPIARTRSDEAGRFHLQVQHARDHLSAVKITAISAANDQAGSRRILAADAPERGGVDLEVKLSPLRTITIGVIDGQLRPVAGARVWVHSAYDLLATTGMTDASGFASFQIPEAAEIFTSAAWKDNDGLDYRSYARPTDRGQPLRRRGGDAEAPTRPFPTDEPEVLKLTGARPLRVHVRNRAGEPIAGASVRLPRLTKVSEMAQLPLDLFDRFRHADSVATDEFGVASIAWMPSWQQAPLTFSVSSPGHATVSAVHDPQEEQRREHDVLDVVLDPLVSVRGRVVDAGGEPRGGILVAAYGAGGPGKTFTSGTQTRSDGSYELQVAPHHNYLLVVEDEELAAAPQSGFRAEPDQPVDEINFVLRKPTRIYGTFYDRDGRPSTRGLTLTQLGRETEGELMAGTLASGDAESADPFGSIDWSRRPTRDLKTVTDNLGRFSLLVGDGVYVVQGQPLADGRRWFEVSQDPEIELEFNPN